MGARGCPKKVKSLNKKFIVNFSIIPISMVLRKYIDQENYWGQRTVWNGFSKALFLSHHCCSKTASESCFRSLKRKNFTNHI